MVISCQLSVISHIVGRVERKRNPTFYSVLSGFVPLPDLQCDYPKFMGIGRDSEIAPTVLQTVDAFAERTY